MNNIITHWLRYIWNKYVLSSTYEVLHSAQILNINDVISYSNNSMPPARVLWWKWMDKDILYTVKPINKK